MWRSGYTSLAISSSPLASARGSSAKKVPLMTSSNHSPFLIGCMPLTCAHMSSSSYIKEAVPKHKSFEVKVAARRRGWDGANSCCRSTLFPVLLLTPAVITAPVQLFLPCPRSLALVDCCRSMHSHRLSSSAPENSWRLLRCLHLQGSSCCMTCYHTQ